MASRIALNNMRNLVVKTSFAYEGTITRKDIITPDGGIIEDVLYYSAPIVKGDLVKLYASEDTANRITVQAAGAGPDIVHGIAVSDPQGIDNTTEDSATPADDLQRRVDVAFFGLAIVEFEATEDITVGHAVQWDTTEAGKIESGSAVPSENGQPIAMTLGADGTMVAVLLGFVGVAADT